MPLKGKRVIIQSGRHVGVEGYVLYEDHDSVAIVASGWFGDVGYWGKYYARKDNIKLAYPSG